MSNIETGIYLDSCICGGHDNRIYHNNFIYNGEQHNGQAQNFDYNYFDDGYPSGGNFWSDYTGMDNYSGPDQTDPGSDGIGDIPYPIEWGVKDNYPLMEVWNMDFPLIAGFTWTPEIPEPGEMILFNASKSYDYDGFITLYEWDWDNDGEYDENHTNSTATHLWSNYGYYPVTLRAHSNNSEKDTERITVRVGNGAPYEAYDPAPEDGATNINPDISGLNWDGDDPDNDPITYDVYFGTSTPPPKVADNMTEASYYIPYTLKFGTKYYWKIVTWDDYGDSTAGPVWSFSTTSTELEVSIIKPDENKLYFRNKNILSLPKNTIVFGYIDIIAITLDEGIEKIEFYINDALKGVDSTAPYIYRWEARSKLPFRYKIKVVAYHTLGYNTIEERMVWKFF
jgi:hypothetical protein